MASGRICYVLAMQKVASSGYVINLNGAFRTSLASSLY